MICLGFERLFSYFWVWFSLRPLQASIRALKGLNEVEANAEPAAKKPPVKRGPQYIQPTIENFKRTKKGRKLMAQELNKLVQLQAKTFPEKSCLDADGKKLSYVFNDKSGSLSLEMFLLKGPKFFDAYFWQIRKKHLFGARVQQWLQKIHTGMSSEYKMKPFQELLWLIDSSDFKEIEGHEAEAGSSEEDD